MPATSPPPELLPKPTWALGVTRLSSFTSTVSVPVNDVQVSYTNTAPILSSLPPLGSDDDLSTPASPTGRDDVRPPIPIKTPPPISTRRADKSMTYHPVSQVVSLKDGQNTISGSGRHSTKQGVDHDFSGGKAPPLPSLPPLLPPPLPSPAGPSDATYDVPKRRPDLHVPL